MGQWINRVKEGEFFEVGKQVCNPICPDKISGIYILQSLLNVKVRFNVEKCFNPNYEKKS